MNDPAFPWHRFALIVALVEKAPSGYLGRTAIMKSVYLLQVLRDLRLNYRFGLYTYGPYDSDVLDDLAFARSLAAVTVDPVEYPMGYGYQVRPGPAAGQIKARAAEFLAKHDHDIAWVMREFGDRTASELELISTIVYADRSLAAKNQRVPLPDLVRRVRAVKPHFTERQVLEFAESLRVKGLLQAIAS